MNFASVNQSAVAWHSGNVKMCVDGNSIMAGTHDGPDSVGGFTGYLYRSVHPFNLIGEYTNVAIGGQNIDNMIASAVDVDGAYDPSKQCVLVVMEGTNKANTPASPQENFTRTMEYIAARRAAHNWACIVCAPPPVWIGDTLGQGYTDDYNAKLFAYNDLLRHGWHQEADAFIDLRCPGSPYDQARYPNYLRSTFFDTTVINGISNNASFTNEGGAEHIRIHMSAAGIIALAPIVAKQLYQLPIRP